MTKYNVELDFRGTFRMRVDANSAKAAFKEAMSTIENLDIDDDAWVLVDRVDSFQVLDENNKIIAV